MALQLLDLNLLRVFEAIFEHRSIVGAAGFLGVTPSAVSHALSRLRRSMRDELFVLGESGMVPTARAMELAPSIRSGLGSIESALASHDFDPELSSRVFRIAASDYGTSVVLRPLIKLMQAMGSQIETRVFPYNRMDIIRHLDEGRIDIALGWFSDVPERIQRKTILVDHEAVLVRAGHPLARAPITLERLLSFPYVVVEVTGSEEQGHDGFVDDRGVWRRIWIDRLLIETSDKKRDVVGSVAVTLPYYAGIPDILSDTDMVATLPRRLALRAVEQNSLVMLDLPYTPLAVEYEALWHSRAKDNQGLLWILQKMVGAVH